MSLKIKYKALRLYVSESDKYQGKLLFESIMLKAREEGIRGVTVYRGIAGYGFSHEIHYARLFEMSQSLPVIIEIIDTNENIEKILPYISLVAPGKLVTMNEINILNL